MQTQSSSEWEAVTPSDTVAFTQTPRAIYVGSAGDIVAVSSDGGTNVTFQGLPAGLILPIRPYRINSTGTTASMLVALY